MGARDPSFIIIESTPKYLLIRDVGPWEFHQSVTNGAEIVVEALRGELGDRRLYYIDSEGQTDELKVENGSFAGFRAGGPK